MLGEKYDNANIIMREEFGWRLYKKDDIRLWFCGYLDDINIEGILVKAEYIVNNLEEENIVSNWLKTLCGHYAIVIEYKSSIITAVDKICSIPLFISYKNNEILISNHAPLLKNKLDLGCSNLDKQAELEIAMSGYTISSKTLYRDIKRLESGEYLFITSDCYYRDFYYTYSPWKVIDRTESQLHNELSNVLLKTFEKIKNNIGDRQIVVPLSAGNDSRLVACGLKKVGLKNVVCFSYGRKGNFETLVSKIIAKKLGYKWIYIPDILKDKKKFFQSKEYIEYISAFKSFAYIHNIQEVYEVFLLKKTKLVDDDAVIVNGNAGDFISGGHIGSILDTTNNPQNVDEISWKKFLNKNFSLWMDLRSLFNDKKIINELTKTLSSRITTSIDTDKYQYAMMECSEYIGRQSKIVMGQQRTYEYFGYEWRLPLWSDDMLTFWESVPYKYKVDQGLYTKVLYENNWGNVWSDIKVNNKVIRPIGLRWLRMLLKILFIPIGKSRWHRFEKNVLEYFLHPSYALAPVPYFRILFNSRGYRSVSSWLSYKMLKGESNS
jgi:asparagine synthase (glutamine-hydrolysing)